MTDKAITLTSEMGVELLGTYGDERTICRRARTSTGASTEEGERTLSRADIGLLRSLVRQHHASPFRHIVMTFAVHAPIFVFRELLRHHVGIDPSEASQRYMEVEPVFWIPAPDRPYMVTEGFKAMRPTFVRASPGQDESTREDMAFAYEEAWSRYQRMLDRGVAKEVARAVLPVATYSTAHITLNLNALMTVLARRTHDPAAAVESWPQAEIEEVARKMEAVFAEHWPTVYAAWVENGRQSL